MATADKNRGQGQRLRQFFRRLRTLFWTSLTILTVLAAVLVGIGKLLMPYSVHYQPELEAWLSKAFNQPVKVESFSGEWKAFGPRISLQGLSLMPDGLQSEIAIKRAALDVKPLNALIPGRPLYSFRIIGADLTLERTSDGRYVLSGLGVSGSNGGTRSGSGLRDVALNGEVRLQDISLSFVDPEHEINLYLNNVNGRLKLDGRRLAAEIQARLSDRDRGRVVGDLDAVVKLRLDSNQRLKQAQWHVNTGELILAELIRQLPHHPLVPVSGRLNAEVWGQWQVDSPQMMQGVLDLRDAQLSSQFGPLLVDHLNSRFSFQFSHRKNWRMDLAGLTVGYAGEEWRSARFSIARNVPANLGLWVSADYLELDYPVQLTQRITANYNTYWPAGIPSRAQGGVTDFDLVLDAKWKIDRITGQLENGHFWGWQKGPDIEGINARIDVEKGLGNIHFDGQAVRLDWLRVFRRPVEVAMNDCFLEVMWRDATDWQLDLNRCSLSNEDITGGGRVRVKSDEGKPEVDINVAMKSGDISRFADYWPENIMSANTLRWLRTSLLDGTIENGRYTMTGDMDDFPFTNHRGRLLALAPVKQANLKYADGWPQARQLDATAIFDGPGMSVEGSIGSTAGQAVDRVRAFIPDFKNAVLDVEWEARSQLPGLIRYIKQTPLLDGLDLDPDQFVFTGSGDLTGRLNTRLRDAGETMTVDGRLLINGAGFTELASGIVLDDIRGSLEFNRNALQANGLAARFKDEAVTLDVQSVWDADEVFRASLSGDLPIEAVIPDELSELEPLFDRATGTSHWNAVINVAAVEGNDQREIWLELTSPLEGVSIDMPAPLSKSATTAWPITVRYPVRASESIVTAVISDQLQLQMALSEQDGRPLSAGIHLGGVVQELPETGFFRISGSTPSFDLDGWVDLAVEKFTRDALPDGLLLESAVLNAGKIRLFDRHFNNVGLTMGYSDGKITGNFESTDIDGSIRYYKNEAGAHSMSAEFERLKVPDALAEGMTMESDPAQLPEMHFYAKSFNYLGVELGETRIEGYPVEKGFHIASVEAKSDSLDFSARGDWLRNGTDDRSDFDIRITSESLGTVLEAMDISSAMRGGQTIISFDAWWHGPPAAFALERLNGDMEFSIIQGNILTADPGAGRMLGLLSLSELPRRLAMDFRDVFEDGYSFDEAKGTMKLENGNSYTDDMTLSSTVAEIGIAGNANLVDQTFDYEFAVRPGVSKTLPVIGAIAGGPVGAAAGLALQAILRDALGEAAEARYTITGTWEDPVIEMIGKLPDTSEADKDTGQKSGGNESSNPLTGNEPGVGPAPDEQEADDEMRQSQTDKDRPLEEETHD
jgi:uncharacterized protein (TIGR02099 family)